METIKALIQSRTTQNVAAGSASGVVVAGLIVASLRHTAPGLLPWDQDMDVAAAGAIGAVVIPWLSRNIAFLRHPDKKTGG